MKNNISNRYQSSPQSGTKPYERKIKVNQNTPEKFFTEEKVDNLEEDEKEIPQSFDNNIQSPNEENNNERYNFTEDIKKEPTETSDNIQNNFEYKSQDQNIKASDFGFSQNFQKQNSKDLNNENDYYSSQTPNEKHYVKKDYQIKYIDGNNSDENNNENPKYSYKYKHKKYQKDERNIYYADNEVEQNEEEDLKEGKEKIDLQELKKKPGKLLLQSTMETYDDEGNRIVTTKTIKEFSQTTTGFRMKDVHQSKERKEYERHTTNNVIIKNPKNKERKTNSSHKNKVHQKGDRVYLLAQLAKIKNESEKKKKNKIYSTSISPIIIHENNGYENQNSILSHEMIDPNSFDKDIYERSNYNYNYPTNYGKINLNNEPDFDERIYYPSVYMRPNNKMQIQEDDYFMEQESRNKLRDIASPIGYIATYSSGSEDNEELGRSYEIERNRINYNNYLTTNSKKKLKNINEYNNDGELIKKREITYEMEFQNDDCKNNKNIQNLSGLEIRANMNHSKSDKKDFQSPDRGFGAGSDRFRKVTMAMISSHGPTCEDRKITRKIRNEIGGVVDLRHEINPENKYEIKKVKRFGFNLNKEVNPKTKIEGARIIQYWWRMLKERKIIKIKILKIIKIQSVIRGFLTRNQIFRSASIFNGFEIIINLFFNHYKDDILKLFHILKKQKLMTKLARLINKVEDKNVNRKLIKYFFKYKFITNLLSKQIDYIKETKKIEVTEEMYINFIKEKYLKSNKSQHINELSIKETEKNKEEEKNRKYELIKNEDFNIINEKPEHLQEKQKSPELKNQGVNTIKVENKIIKNDFIKLIYKKKETAEKGTSLNYSEKTSPKKICRNEKITYINKKTKIDKGQQMDTIKNIIKKNESINILSKTPKKRYYNSIRRSESFRIINNRKKYKDEEIQYIPEKNAIQNQTLEFKREKPKTKDDYSQYISAKNTICRSNSYSILRNPKKPTKLVIRKNNFSIIKKNKITKEKGEQCEFDKKYKSKEILIGNNRQRSNIKNLYDIIEYIWMHKQFKKFIKNFKSKIKEEAIKKELMRMILLKWRFIKGYGGDRYGNIYDRNGKKIGEKEGKIKDISIQNTLNEEINNALERNKKLQIKIIKQKPLYIKSNLVLNKKIMIDTGTGEEVNHILSEKMAKTVSIAFKRKPKPMNKISSKNYFKISKVEKGYKHQGTQMLPAYNKIVNENRIFINNDQTMNKQRKRRDLLIQIISKSIIREKYKFNDCFSNWYKKTMRIIEQERTRKSSINKSKIIKNEKFEIINKKDKRDKSCGNVYVPNKVVRGTKIEFRQKKFKKDEGILISFPHEFKQEDLKKSRINNDIYKSKKNPIVLRKIQSESTMILGEPKKKIINQEILEKIIMRKKEILIKYIKSQKTPESLLRKYFTLWSRKAQYLSLLDNANIISTYCKSKLNQIKTVQRWQKLYQKYLFDIRQNNVMKMLKMIKIRKNKILHLIRITTLIRFYNKRAFLHKIIMYWFIYSIDVAKKRNQMKMMYKNMLTTYVSMADDIFGKNQKNNPSIQDVMFEIVDSNKYQVKELEDVPMAKTYYSKKKEEKKVITNIKYIHRDLEEEKETTYYKETKKYYYPRKNLEKIPLKERISNTEGKKGNLSKAINLSFNYNDSSIFEEKNAKRNLNDNYIPNIKKYGYRDYSQTNNISGNNNYSLNNSSYSNNNYKTKNYTYQYKNDNSDYKIYSNNNTNISFNKINVNNNVYSNIKRDDKNSVLYKGIYGENRSLTNNNKSDFDYNKYKDNINNNKSQINYNNNYTSYISNYDEKNKRNYVKTNNEQNYYNKIKPEEKSKYISNYYRRNINNYDNNDKK